MAARTARRGAPPPPRFRVEHRHPDLAAGIVAFADSPLLAEAALAVAAARLRRHGAGGRLAVVDQATEELVAERAVGPMASGGGVGG